MVWFQCDPPNALWDPLQQDKCDYRRNAYYTYFVGAIAALSDFYFAIIPIKMLIPLRIDRKLKWGLSFLMGLGLVAGVAAVIRSWAAKYVVSEDSSCKLRCLFHSTCCSHHGNTDQNRRRRDALPLGRNRRMARPHRHVNPADLATVPALGPRIHQIKHVAKPIAEVSTGVPVRLRNGGWLDGASACHHDGINHIVHQSRNTVAESSLAHVEIRRHTGRSDDWR